MRLQTAQEIAHRIARAEPAALAMTKSLVNAGQSVGLQELRRIEEHAQAVALGTPRTQHAVSAFLAGNGTPDHGETTTG